MIDTGGTLHEYYSDLTRTFALPGTRLSKRQLQIWYDVQEAQSAALAVAKNGTLTRTVDEAARGVLEKKGLADYFTHRLGHGIGIEMHESPYLTGGSEDLILTGHTFSDEPGVYIDGDVGVLPSVFSVLAVDFPFRSGSGSRIHFILTTMEMASISPKL